MKKLNELKTNAQFNEMEVMLQTIHGLKSLEKNSYQEILKLEEDGFYSPLTNEAFNTVPSGERWYTKYEVTYQISCLLVDYVRRGHVEAKENMIRCLKASIKKGYFGHSYDAHFTRLKYLTKLYKSGLMEVCDDERVIDEIEDMVLYYRQRLLTNQTQEGFGDIEKDIIALLKIVDQDLIFVYGTLMNNECNHYHLNEATYVDEAIAYDKDLYQLSGYPGMVDGNGVVGGEVYKINNDIKCRLDILEGSQYEYKDMLVYGADGCYYCHYYEFITQPRKRYKKAYIDDNHKWLNTNNLVWYACYGSNLLEKRFEWYIQNTTSKNWPIAEEKIMLPYTLYFGNSSSRWNDQGVAFLDMEKPGCTYGYMYLITKQQLSEIEVLEGRGWYPKQFVKKHEDGLPIYTLTSKDKFDVNTPSTQYLEIIGAGIKQHYEFTNEYIEEYLQVTDLNLTSRNIKRIMKEKFE